ncbi:MAG: DEAD/DEAH box helicase, partial [Candidatus Eremiobacterota bacterium]
MLDSVADLFPFPLDDFQWQAMEAIERGQNVIVSAPTGSGKTAIAEFALHRARANQRRCFYTTPLKALSNQKFHDLQRLFGDSSVGLLTGDVSVNRDAPVVVMTTEVFRNMLYGTILGDVRSNLAGVESVILDECHYMNDVERGTVWEESIIYCPRDTQLVALSATVANAGELCEWMSLTHAPTHLISTDFRPVPLRFYFFHKTLHRLLTEAGRLNPALRALKQHRDG